MNHSISRHCRHLVHSRAINATAFDSGRKMIASHEDLKFKIEAMEKKYDNQFRIVFEAITQLIEEDDSPKLK